jgi:hypothetical protein
MIATIACIVVAILAFVLLFWGICFAIVWPIAHIGEAIHRDEEWWRANVAPKP